MFLIQTIPSSLLRTVHCSWTNASSYRYLWYFTDKFGFCDTSHSECFIIFQLHSREPISTYFLTDTLSKALQLVPLKDNPFADNIAISKTKIPRNMETYSLNAFSWLSLTYKVCFALFTTDFKRTHFSHKTGSGKISVIQCNCAWMKV